jgi:glutamate dehydrogenase
MDSTAAGAGAALDRERVVQAFADRAGRGDAETAFLARVLADYQEDELPGWTEDALAEVLAGLWRFGQAETGAFRIERAPLPDALGRPLDLVLLTEPEKPFIVDSVMGELAAHGLDLRAMFHAPVATPKGPALVMLVVVAALGEDRRGAVEDGLRGVLADVRVAVADFPAMLALMEEAVEELEQGRVKRDPEALAEELAFLRWLTADRFVFLGARVYTYPRDSKGDYVRDQPEFDRARSLGVLKDASRSVLRRASEPAVLAKSPRQYLERSPPLVVAKANLRARVHRRAYMDYVGVRRYDDQGAVEGEIRFVGLFTVDAYEEPAHDLPLLRRKVARVLARMGENRGDHSERRLRHIVETYPRDELFQIDEEDLHRTALGVLHLYDRPRLRLFARKDPFDRFLSALLFLPRDHYDAELQERAGEILAEAFKGRVSAVYPSFTDGPLARLHFIIGLDPGRHPNPDLAAVEAALAAAAETWEDRLAAALREGEPRPGGVAPVLHRWRDAFPAGYRDHNDAEDALADLTVIDGWGEAPLHVRAFRRPGDPDSRFRFKLYVRGAPAPLSDVLPILEHMGLRALEEAGFELNPAPPRAGGETTVWVHEYLMEDSLGQALALDDLEQPFAETFAAVWTGQADSDGFNRLVLDLGVSWRQAALVRAVAAWRRQSGLDPSQAVQETALRDHPGVARLILDLFAVKFDPAVEATLEARRERATAIQAEIDAALQAVASLEADRALRRMAGAVAAMTRTNFHQPDEAGAPKSHIAFKIDSGAAADLPLPRPFREIFVAGPRVEGVHLRFGPVARGGLRWSDRREDYRTEVLGLVKTQHVKNAVIVPVGAKGGFYPKQLPREGGAAARAEAVEAYKLYLGGLLDLTDNLDIDGKVVRPAGVIAHDADDPYLVVAADKGTASFSDTANAVATARGFWLGDAFASGGSAGYDHKAMGITARGAWEAVKRHFREMDKDIQSEPFTCVGVGDMSGDVFGNGLLRSETTRLVAAFDHRHLFLDPNPDPAASFAERQRLFELPTSSWADYDAKRISAGGGVFPRTAKSVAITPEVRALLDIQDETLTPADLIRAILKAPVELLYLGGIGCYVKAPQESHAQVMDKANDALRVDATELRCQVVGEGANLGFTQAGRIAYARAGGRIDTDAIDNSAGVDTSDHEVNIKILLERAIKAGSLRREERDDLLRAMTDEVAAHVLAHNYAQTLSLTLQQATAVEDLDAHADFVADLAARGRLDVAVEGLPGRKGFEQLKAQGLGLSRPELAVVSAYAKLELAAELDDGPLPDDPWFEAALAGYFPDELARFEAERRAHPLRRAIIGAVAANVVVDMAGPTFVHRMKAALGSDAASTVAIFEAARAIFRLDEVWRAVHALDLKIPAATQTTLYLEIALVLRAQTYWLASRSPRGQPVRIGPLVEAYQPCADALKAGGEDLLSPFEQQRAGARRQAFVDAGAPEEMAAAVAALRSLTATIEVADLARELGWPIQAAARQFHAAGAAFGFDRLKAAAAVLHRGDAFEQMAVRRLIAELIGDQRALARAIGGDPPKDRADAEAAVAAWIKGHPTESDQALDTMEAVESAGDGWTFARLTIAAAALRDLVR